MSEVLSNPSRFTDLPELSLQDAEGFEVKSFIEQLEAAINQGLKSSTADMKNFFGEVYEEISHAIIITGMQMSDEDIESLELTLEFLKYELPPKLAVEFLPINQEIQAKLTRIKTYKPLYAQG